MSESPHLTESMLVRLADGELSAEESAWLGRHLETCGECRAARAKFTAIDGELTEWGLRLGAENPARSDARERLAAGLGPLAAPRGTSYWRAGAAVAIAAGLALAIVWPRPARLPVTRQGRVFIEIPYVAPLDPHENSTIVRMDIRVATLMSVGYKIAGDPDAIVHADVLVGEDGRAHAVRVLNDIEWNGTGD